MNRNIIIFTSLSLAIIIFGILLTTYGIIKLSNITVENDFSSQILEDEFDLIIYTPPAYSLHYKQRYPVLYLLDGEDYFIERKEDRRAKWSMQRTIDRLIKEERLPGLIVVGITPSNHRADYYTPSFVGNSPYGGQAGELARFIASELKPYIDTKYRTKTEAELTGIAGAGLGGLAALSIAADSPDVFGKAGALAPIKDELESPFSTQELMAELENFQHSLLSSSFHHEQDVYLVTDELIGSNEELLDQHLGNLLLHLFDEN